jgi:hypothetical protein
VPAVPLGDDDLIEPAPPQLLKNKAAMRTMRIDTN